jgi:hypothetical protein
LIDCAIITIFIIYLLSMINKQTILQIKNVYTANAFHDGKGFYVGAGSETEPDVRLYDMISQTEESLDDCPGGMMGFIPIPGIPGVLVSIMGLFPPFIGKDAGIFLHVEGEGGWKTGRAMDLPFAHRCEFITSGDEIFLVAATVSRHKEHPGDWSQKGEVHLIPFREPQADSWESSVISSSVTRNHGMVRALAGGKETVCVSGAEGIFAISPASHGSWELTRLFDREVSEMSFIDLDGDGVPELVTVEPFHGDSLNIYKNREDGWKLRYSDSLSFGHGLSSGMYNGRPVIAVGNRDASLALEIFTIDNLGKGIVNRRIIEENAGPTQTQVFTFAGMDYILSANQKKHEVALYSGSLY